MKRYLTLFALACLMSCAGEKENAVLKEAHEVQEKTIKLLSDLGEAVSSQPEAMQDSLKELIHEMEESLFEIPGYHLHLPGHEGHDHSHDHDQVNLSDEDILKVQKELYQQAQAIQKSLN